MALQAAANIVIAICAGNTTLVDGEKHSRRSIWGKVGKSNTHSLVDVCLSQDCLLDTCVQLKARAQATPSTCPQHLSRYYFLLFMVWCVLP